MISGPWGPKVPTNRPSNGSRDSPEQMSSARRVNSVVFDKCFEPTRALKMSFVADNMSLRIVSFSFWLNSSERFVSCVDDSSTEIETDCGPAILLLLLLLLLLLVREVLPFLNTWSFCFLKIKLSIVEICMSALSRIATDCAPLARATASSIAGTSARSISNKVWLNSSSLSSAASYSISSSPSSCYSQTGIV